MRTQRAALSFGALIFILAMLLAGCSTGGSSNKIILTYWYTENAQQAPAIRDLIIKFEQQNPNVTINAQHIDPTTAHDKFVQAAKANKAPDVFRADIRWGAEFAADGYLADITSMESSFDKSDYLTTPLTYCEYQGKLIGLPQTTDLLVLYYNKSLFSAAHLNGAPTTWEQFDADNRALTHGAQYGWAWQASSYYTQQFIFSFGGELFKGSGKSLSPAVNSQSTITALTYLKQELAYAPKPDFANGVNTAMSAFESGQAGMIMANQSDYSTLLTGSAFAKNHGALGVAAIPMDTATGNTPRSPVGGQEYVMFKGTQQPTAAFQFMQFMSSAPSQSYLATKDNLLPTRHTNYSDPQVQADATLMAFAALLPTQKATPVFKQAAQVYDPSSGFDTNLQKFVNGQETAATAAQNISASFQSLLNG